MPSRGDCFVEGEQADAQLYAKRAEVTKAREPAAAPPSVTEVAEHGGAVGLRQAAVLGKLASWQGASAHPTLASLGVMRSGHRGYEVLEVQPRCRGMAGWF